MHLSTLLHTLYPLPPAADKPMTGLSLDSRNIKPGDLFLALKGVQWDGEQFISQAIGNGAAAVIREGEDTLTWTQDIPIISLPNLQQQLGEIAARFYGEPAKQLRIIGVTGTSGKTSCTHFIAQALQHLKIPCGLIGTLGSGIYPHLGEAGLTTPDALSLQALLAQFVKEKITTVAMEVSSHSIQQGRVNHIDFEVGIFTNLSQDHLDYHGDMQSYADVKRRFMFDFPMKHKVFNADDLYAKEWLAAGLNEPSFAYTLHAPQFALKNVEYIYVEKLHLSSQGMETVVVTPWGKGEVTLPLIGEFNLSNGLAVLTTLCLYGIPFSQALMTLNQLNSVPGRMQLVRGENQPLVVVDYAHKPDALEKVLQALRAHTKARLICVFGCGGNRDQGKRPLMAAIAERCSDLVIVTSDNPRHEDPDIIIQQITAGFSHPEKVEIEPDRSKAIKKSIQSANVADCVLIAGKGAEHYQQIGDTKLPFDDVNEVQHHLQQYKAPPSIMSGD